MNTVQRVEALEKGLAEGTISAQAEQTRLGDALVTLGSALDTRHFVDRTSRLLALAPRLRSRLGATQFLPNRAKILYGLGVNLAAATSSENLESAALTLSNATTALEYLETSFTGAWNALVKSTFDGPRLLAKVIGQFDGLKSQARDLTRIAKEGGVLASKRLPTDAELAAYDQLCVDLAAVDLNSDPAVASLVAFLRKVEDGTATLSDASPKVLQELGRQTTLLKITL